MLLPLVMSHDPRLPMEDLATLPSSPSAGIPRCLDSSSASLPCGFRGPGVTAMQVVLCLHSCHFVCFRSSRQAWGETLPNLG